MDLAAFVASIHEWTERLLEKYLSRLAEFDDGSRTSSKQFNDAVWSTVSLRPIEVVLLDSPLLQRLRHIRQLGVVHLVYSSATHSRIDHTIGTVHQISRLVDAINDPEVVIDTSTRNLLRLAALNHDIGHGVMSHVSENAMRGLPAMTAMMGEFSREIDRERGKPSEAVAYYMLSSPAFERLLTEGQRITGDHTLPHDAVDLMRKAVIGKQISNEVPLLHELISGPFDADKLDYMTRDARMSGVPVVTDIPRLVQKVRGKRLQATRLPTEVKEDVKEEEGGHLLTGISLSGGRTLDELMFGQTLLFDKLYRHQKVRAIEAMVASVYDQIAPMCGIGELLAPYELLDAELLHLHRETLERFAGRELGADDEQHAEVAEDICARIFDRRLFRRAYAFAQNMPLDPYRMDIDHTTGLISLASDARGYRGRQKLLKEIVAETHEILRLLGLEDCLDHFPGRDIEPYIRIDPPGAAAQGNDTARAYLISDSASGPPVIRFKDEYAETTGWSNAYLLTRDTGYIFAPDELALPVYLASEKTARCSYGVRTPASMLAYAKHDPIGLMDAKRTLEDAGYYQKVPYDIRPLPERLEKADYRDRIDRVLARLQGYEGPVPEGQETKKGTVMRSARVEAWIQQFGVDFSDEALHLAERLSLVGRRAINNAVSAFGGTEGGEPFAEASITPLGDAKDSSAPTTYYAGDVAPRIHNLGEALRLDAPILFAEDFVGSGAQTITILHSWFGIEPETNLHEDRDEPLPGPLQEALKERPLALVYAAGRRAGAEAVEAAAQKLDLNLTVYLHEDEAPVAFVPGTNDAFVDRCREIGFQLLTDENPDHDDEWVAQRVLGYGNDAFLVVFPYNTPTQSLTCLWREGIVDGVEWMPLLPRRQKR